MINFTHHPSRLSTGHRDSLSGAQISGDYDRRNAQDRRLLLVLMLVGDNLRRQLVIRDLAAAVNLSSGRLAHLFKSEVGVSPQRYLNNLRTEKARELLEHGLLSVKEIAAEVGIPDVSRLCRCFKARYGMTPTEYRKTHLKIELQSIRASALAA